MNAPIYKSSFLRAESSQTEPADGGTAERLNQALLRLHERPFLSLFFCIFGRITVQSWTTASTRPFLFFSFRTTWSFNPIQVRHFWSSCDQGMAHCAPFWKSCFSSTNTILFSFPESLSKDWSHGTFAFHDKPFKFFRWLKGNFCKNLKPKTLYKGQHLWFSMTVQVLKPLCKYI